MTAVSLVKPAPRHACGVCNMDALRFRYTEAEQHWWECFECGSWHTSEDCCQHPYVVEGDRIVLTYMAADPDPIAVGETGTIRYTPTFDQHSPASYDQYDVVWDNGRSLFLSAAVDRFERLPDLYVIREDAL